MNVKALERQLTVRAPDRREQLTAMALSPITGGGANLRKLSPMQTARIQTAADRNGVTIILIGSRAAGLAGPVSDQDYILIGGNARQRHSVRDSLPAGPGGVLPFPSA